MIERKIAKVQRDIARIARTPEEAQYIVRLLSSTNWEMLIEHDRSHRKQHCTWCAKRFLCTRLTSLMQSNGVVGMFCSECLPKVERYCDYCDQRFARNTWSSYRCYLCYQAHQDVPHLLTCGLCYQKYAWTNDWDILICGPCREARNIDARWIRNERVKIMTHEGRARTLGLPADLPLIEWIHILDHFHWLCAYCQLAPYQQLDHFIPLCKNGASTVTNCVPACQRCNTMKGQRHPAKVTSIPRRDLDRVQNFLVDNK